MLRIHITCCGEACAGGRACGRAMTTERKKKNQKPYLFLFHLKNSWRSTHSKLNQQQLETQEKAAAQFSLNTSQLRENQHCQETFIWTSFSTLLVCFIYSHAVQQSMELTLTALSKVTVLRDLQADVAEETTSLAAEEGFSLTGLSSNLQAVSQLCRDTLLYHRSSFWSQSVGILSQTSYILHFIARTMTRTCKES